MSETTEQSSLASLIVTMHEAGYSVDEILKELKHKPGLKKVSRNTVVGTIEKAVGRGADSRMLMALYDMQVQILSLVREMVSENRKTKAMAAARKLERQLLAKPLARRQISPLSASEKTNPC